MYFKDSRPQPDIDPKVKLRKSVIQAARHLLAQHSNYAAERAANHADALDTDGRDLCTNTEIPSATLLLPTDEDTQ